jgi:hypothetical protein
MKILIASELNTTNQYVDELYKGISKHCFIRCSAIEFFNPSTNYDIVHIMWPEELWGYNRNKTIDDFTRKIVEFKSLGIKLVFTLHNEKPHNNDPDYKLLYKLIIDHLDAIIHLGKYSSNKYSKKINESAVSILIPHPNYSSFYNVNANNKNTNQSQKIRLIFPGKIRNSEEAFLLASSLYLIRKSNLIIKVLGNKFILRRRLLISNCRKYISYYFKMLIIEKVYNLLDFTKKELTNIQLEEIVNQSDAILCLRCESLNSGIPYLAATFEKPVVGPEIGNINEFLVNTKNYIFIPSQKYSLSNQLKKLIKDIEQNNIKLDYSSLISNDEIIENHILLYKRILKSF